MGYRYEPHRPQYSRVSKRLICRRCGLIYLKNAFTEWCVRMGCEHTEHPDYQRQRDSAGKDDRWRRSSS